MLIFQTGISTVFGGTQCNCQQCQNEAVCSLNNTCDCIEDYVGDTCSERYSERCGGLVMCQNGAECVYDEGGRIVQFKFVTSINIQLCGILASSPMFRHLVFHN